jgi:hypothetical protein
MDKGTTSPTAQRNNTCLAGRHNRQDMKAIECYSDDIEIVEMPTGVVYKGMDKMRELAGMAYRRNGWKELTNIIATETEACVEYVASADISAPLTEEEKRSGIHGVDISKAKSTTAPFAIPVCYTCHFREHGKIDRVREYWDVATMTRQFGIENLKAKILRFFMRRVSKAT